jgi:hypothetical protein
MTQSAIQQIPLTWIGTRTETETETETETRDREIDQEMNGEANLWSERQVGVSPSSNIICSSIPKDIVERIIR